METNYRRNKPLNVGFKILASAFIALVLLTVAYADFLEAALANSVFNFLKPILKFSISIKNNLNGFVFIFADKIRLAEENNNLRATIDDLKGQLESLAGFEKENKELREMLSRIPEEKILANVILLSPEISFDAFILDVGGKDGVKAGMSVVSSGDVFLGYINEVYEQTSRAVLVSYFNQENNAFLENSGTPITITGMGGEMMKFSLPREASVQTGEKVLTTAKTTRLIGFVEKIEKSSTNSLQNIILRLPLNIRNLRTVLIIK
ncbi:MAG: rod shape-determining protein MreC [Patescibacteria group bacterium]